MDTYQHTPQKEKGKVLILFYRSNMYEMTITAPVPSSQLRDAVGNDLRLVLQTPRNHFLDQWTPTF